MVIAVADVERWVQPDLIEKKTVGEAFLAFVGSGGSQVSIVGPAKVAVVGRAATATAVDADIGVALIAPALLRPAVTAQATFSLVTEARTDDYHATAAIALIGFEGKGADQVAVSGSVLFGVYDRSSFAVAVTGDAEISFGDFGMDVPIFPMQFPYQFTDASLLRFGTAEVDIGGVGLVDAVKVTGTATVAINGKTRLSFKGSIPVFPFGFPAVFDSEANVRFGTALVAFGSQPSVSAVAVEAAASVPIYGASFALHQTIFAFAFPAVFDSSGYSVAEAVFGLASDGSTVVVLDADAVVDVSTSMSVDSSAVFPWEFGVIFQ